MCDHNMSTHVTVLLAAVSLLSGATCKRPNVVLIAVDDLGWGDVSFHGSDQVETPNIDALAATGVVLNNYYVSPLCSPSRSALLSARHPIHTGMQHHVLGGGEPWGFPLQYRLMPQFLKNLGYETHLVRTPLAHACGLIQFVITRSASGIWATIGQNTFQLYEASIPSLGI